LNAKLLTQQVLKPAVMRDRLGAVSGHGERAKQLPVGLLPIGIQSHRAPGPAEDLTGGNHRFRLLRERHERT
jgi:hypothetical protein